MSTRDVHAPGEIRPREQWGTRIGLILAMAGNAVGLGIDEKRYDIHENHPYTEEEEAEALAKCDVAETVLTIIANAKENI